MKSLDFLLLSFFFFPSLFVGLSADSIILSLLLRKITLP